MAWTQKNGNILPWNTQVSTDHGDFSSYDAADRAKVSGFVAGYVGHCGDAKDVFDQLVREGKDTKEFVSTYSGH